MFQTPGIKMEGRGRIRSDRSKKIGTIAVWREAVVCCLGYGTMTPHLGLVQLRRMLMRSAFCELHRLQQEMRLPGSLPPPREWGVMWSTVSASPPQYAQVCASRLRIDWRSRRHSSVRRSGLLDII